MGCKGKHKNPDSVPISMVPTTHWTRQARSKLDLEMIGWNWGSRRIIDMRSNVGCGRGVCVCVFVNQYCTSINDTPIFNFHK